MSRKTAAKGEQNQVLQPLAHTRPQGAGRARARWAQAGLHVNQPGFEWPENSVSSSTRVLAGGRHH
jgi:hypothetical protein